MEFIDRFREREIRAQLLATAARLGHAFIDLYVLIINRIGSFSARVPDTTYGQADIVPNPMGDLMMIKIRLFYD